MEFEYRVNRKLAKQIYAEEKMNRVNSNKEQNKMYSQSRLQSLVLEYNDKERKFFKEKMHIEQVQQNKVEQMRKHRE